MCERTRLSIALGRIGSDAEVEVEVEVTAISSASCCPCKPQSSHSLFEPSVPIFVTSPSPRFNHVVSHTPPNLCRPPLPPILP